MPIPDQSNNVTLWTDDTYVGVGDSFDSWRKKTNGLRTLMDGSVTNAKVAADAAIVDTKLATIATAGKVSNSATTGTIEATPDTLVLRDTDGGITGSSLTTDQALIDGPLVINNNTGEDNFIQFPDGTQQYTAAERQLLPRAWVSFNGNADISGIFNTNSNANKFIYSSYNVSSVTKTASGLYTINFNSPLKNRRYLVTGTINQGYTNEAANNTFFGLGAVAPYHQEINNVKITAENIGDGLSNPNLVNIIVYGTDAPETAIPSGTFTAVLNLTITQRDGDVWNMYGRISSANGPATGYKYKITNNFTANTSLIQSSTQTTILTKSNSGTNNITVSTVEIYNSSNEFVISYDIKKNFNTFDSVNGNTSKVFTVTNTADTSNPNAVYNQISNTIASGTTTINFTVTIVI